MRADPPDLVGQQRAARCATAPPANTMLREANVPKPNGVDRGVAVAHRDLRGIDAEFLRGDLRQRRLQPLAVVLDADIACIDRAVRQHARRRRSRSPA